MPIGHKATVLPDIVKYCDLAGLLEGMEERGSSVDLNYGEDNRMWECSWIVGGERFTSLASTPDDAARSCAQKVADREPTCSHSHDQVERVGECRQGCCTDCHCKACDKTFRAEAYWEGDDEEEPGGRGE